MRSLSSVLCALFSVPCMSANKVRIRFGKTGDLRFLSHHDLLRVWERMMRRAALPFRSTEGFHPMPKLSLASALGLGIVGREEVAEIEFEEELPADEVHRRLEEQAPPGLCIQSVRAIERRQTAQVCRACYFLHLEKSEWPALSQQIAALLAQDECWVERTKPHPRRINIRPYLRDLTLTEDGLSLDFTVTPQGSARPDEVLRLLGLCSLLDSGAILERTVVEIQDEESSQLSVASCQLQTPRDVLQLNSGH